MATARGLWNAGGVKPAAAPCHGRVLIIAGSDSGGGAGLQADIKTVTVLGGYASTAVTAVTVQDTLKVYGVHPIPLEVIEAQARAVLDDLGADVVKTGMLGDAPTVALVADILRRARLPAVVDPVMAAKDGSPLLAPDALEAVRQGLAPLASLLTPNAPEAALLTGLSIENPVELERAGEALLRLGCQAVLMKGGHVPGPQVVDILMTPQASVRFSSPRVETRHTHGTGCTLASACAVGLAQGLDLAAAVARARAYVQGALLNAPGLGGGHGPLGHGWVCTSATAVAS